MAGNRDLTLGVFFVASMVSSSLWGVSGLQTYSYFTSYQRDTKWLKGLVVATWSIDTLHQALISHANYFYLVTNWGTSPPTTRIVWSARVQMLVSAFLAFVVQSFFVFRIWKLSKQNIFLTTPVTVLVLAQFAGYTAYSGKIYANRLYDFRLLAEIQDLDTAINILTAAADVSLAITLSYLLHKSRTGFKRSDTMIKKLILYTINTGLFTSVNVLCALITYLASPGTLLYVLFYFIFARLYFNSLMANLNARKVLRSRLSHLESLSLSNLPTSNRTGPSGSLPFAGEQPVLDSSVKVDTIFVTRGDFDRTASDDRKSTSAVLSTLSP